AWAPSRSATRWRSPWKWPPRLGPRSSCATSRARTATSRRSSWRSAGRSASPPTPSTTWAGAPTTSPRASARTDATPVAPGDTSRGWSRGTGWMPVPRVLDRAGAIEGPPGRGDGSYGEEEGHGGAGRETGPRRRDLLPLRRLRRDAQDGGLRARLPCLLGLRPSPPARGHAMGRAPARSWQLRGARRDAPRRRSPRLRRSEALSQARRGRDPEERRERRDPLGHRADRGPRGRARRLPLRVPRRLDGLGGGREDHARGGARRARTAPAAHPHSRRRRGAAAGPATAPP